jgi:RimJ/RimL family protein N-acetyltransferase
MLNKKAEISCYTTGWLNDKPAIQTIIEHGFRDLHLHRIWAETFFTHAEHVKILEELGFECEGVMRDSYWKDGKYINSFIHSILRK